MEEGKRGRKNKKNELSVRKGDIYVRGVKARERQKKKEK